MINKQKLLDDLKLGWSVLELVISIALFLTVVATFILNRGVFPWYVYICDGIFLVASCYNVGSTLLTIKRSLLGE